MGQKVLSQRDLEDTQQPIGKDGFSNPWFDKLYGKKNNPHTGTERDWRKRRGSGIVSGFRPAGWLIEREKEKLKKLKFSRFFSRKDWKEYKEIKKWLKQFDDEKV